ncbi:hypothetical protein [Caulobacter phage KcrB]|nr:hypothetical protein RW_GP012 [Caulobacter phage RW]WCA46316.1 hypothetical protein [Caulobacter phage KcrB]WCD56251.1 hypothetical protein [Caulobacter phage RLK]WNV48043.1 hypothetical protein GB2A_gp011 [Caulobacter phage GB2A]
MSITFYDCQPFPNTRIFFKARKVRDGYQGRVVTSEASAWGVCNNTYKSTVTRTTREEALTDADNAAREGARTGYVPTF